MKGKALDTILKLTRNVFIEVIIILSRTLSISHGPINWLVETNKASKSLNLPKDIYHKERFILKHSKGFCVIHTIVRVGEQSW